MSSSVQIRIVAVGGLMLLGACDGKPPTATLMDAESTSTVAGALNSEMYPTEQEWLAEGGSLYGGFEI